MLRITGLTKRYGQNAALKDLSLELAAGQFVLAEHGIPATRVNKVYEGRPHIVDLMKDDGVQLVFNTTEGAQSIDDSREIRSLALSGRIPYFTTANASRAAAMAMKARLEGELGVRALQG